MSQKYKVYFANRPVIFTQESPAERELGKGCEVILSTGKMDTVLIESAIRKGARRIFIVCPDADAAWRAFADQFTFVQAAGGLVEDPKGRLLFIFRMEKWDLPKGKVEDEEEIRSGALREVEEECGITDLEILTDLCITWHTYIQEGEPMLKATSWFVMSYSGGKKPQPQTEEGITEVRWLKWEELDTVRSNTYPSVLDVIEAYKSWKG